jgi:hypothetical protein
VVSNGESSAIPALSLAQVPSAVLKVAQDHLKHAAEVESSSAEEWANAELAPFATPLGEPNVPGGPSHFEFKVISKPKPTAGGGMRKFASDQKNVYDRGYIVCSATDADLPVCQFATEGSTPVEILLRKCGNVVPARIVRYGGTFWVAENEQGELIANHGGEPFKYPSEYLAYLTTYTKGVFDTESTTKQRPPTSKAVPGFFAIYADFKNDYITNAVHKLLRRRLAENAKIFWDAERGIMPAILRVDVGETNSFLTRSVIDQLTIDDELNIRTAADVDILKAGGIRVYGRFAGRTPIVVRTGENLTAYVVEVAPAIAPAKKISEIAAVVFGEAYWRTVAEDYAGNWGDQMKWWQLRDNVRWCNAVGCGPTALGMLLGWWEHKNSVESAFYTSATSFESLSTIDAPYELDTLSKRAKVRAAYIPLHDLCDVICSPVSDEGATLPDDLIEGWFNYLMPVAEPGGAASLLYGSGQALVGHTTPWALGGGWDYSGKTVAVGIKDGHPGVIGLSSLLHYAVAYGYKRVDKFNKVNGVEQSLGISKRYLKCNEGWGESSATWYAAEPVYLGLTTSMWQKRAPRLN